MGARLHLRQCHRRDEAQHDGPCQHKTPQDRYPEW